PRRLRPNDSLRSSVRAWYRAAPCRARQRRAAGLTQQRFDPHHFVDDVGHPAGERPGWIVSAEFSHVADVADVVALAVLFVVAPRHLASRSGLDHVETFEDRRVALAAAAEVVDLADARRGDELLEGAHHIQAVNLIAHL